MGAKIYYYPDAIVYHYVPKQHATLKYLFERYYSFGVSNSVRYQLKYPNDISRLLEKNWKRILFVFNQEFANANVKVAAKATALSKKCACRRGPCDIRNRLFDGRNPFFYEIALWEESRISSMLSVLKRGMALPKIGSNMIIILLGIEAYYYLSFAKKLLKAAP